MGKVAALDIKLLSPAEVEALPDLEWLIPGILPVPALAMLYGEPGSGKTFTALAMACAVASGHEFVGRPTKKAPALYVAAEGVVGLKKRIAAYRLCHGLSEDHIRFVPRAFDIRDATHIEALLSTLEQAECAPRLIIIDTLARVMVGADENSAKDMGLVVEGLEKIKSATGATVLVIHHTRKGDKLVERGSSALRGAADVMITCEKWQNFASLGINITCSKMKDDEPFNPFGAMLDKVDVGGGRTSLVVGGPFSLQALAGHADTIIEILKTDFAELGATHKELKAAFIAKGGSGSTFDRTWRDLKKTERIEVRNVDGKDRIFPADE